MNPSEQKQAFTTPELTVKDLTKALYEVSTQLEEANHHLLKEQQEKDEIFANISHDLRSPITTINNSVEYLLSLEQIDSTTLTQTLLLMKKKGEYLHQLIEDVFLFCSVNSGVVSLDKEEIPMVMYLEDFYYGYEIDPRYKERALSAILPQDYEYYVSIDSKLFHRVLDNLFSNALKFSSNGDSIQLHAIADNATKLKIQVIDTGMGIDPEHKELIFNRTYKEDSSRTPSNNVGCGLGLAIAKSIIEQLDGTIECDSMIGKGSTFTITLPVVKRERI